MTSLCWGDHLDLGNARGLLERTGDDGGKGFGGLREEGSQASLTAMEDLMLKEGFPNRA